MQAGRRHIFRLGRSCKIRAMRNEGWSHMSGVSPEVVQEYALKQRCTDISGTHVHKWRGGESAGNKQRMLAAGGAAAVVERFIVLAIYICYVTTQCARCRASSSSGWRRTRCVLRQGYSRQW
eukprot:8597053-Heterocapsa_arctica.AAC.1